jgi:hypothetical protein
VLGIERNTVRPHRTRVIPAQVAGRPHHRDNFVPIGSATLEPARCRCPRTSCASLFSCSFSWPSVLNPTIAGNVPASDFRLHGGSH